MSLYCLYLCFFFFFKQKTAYEMRISDWSSDVCSSDLVAAALDEEAGDAAGAEQREGGVERDMAVGVGRHLRHLDAGLPIGLEAGRLVALVGHQQRRVLGRARHQRSEEHTSELQSLMRISYAVFCLQKKKTHNKTRMR